MNHSSGPKRDSKAKSAQRILDIFELLGRANDRRGMTATDIAAALDLPKSSAHYLLDLLTGRHYLERDADSRRYTLGPQLFEVGCQYATRTGLYEAAKPVLDRINRVSGEAVSLDVLHRMDVLTVAREMALYRYSLRTALGDRIPAHASSTGKVLLSGLSDEELRRRYGARPLEKYTEHTVDSLEGLMAVIRLVRTEGVVYNREELFIGGDSVAVPVRDRTGRVVAALAVMVPSSKDVGDYLDRLGSLVRLGGDIISARLGYRSPTGRMPMDPAEIVYAWDGKEREQAGDNRTAHLPVAEVRATT